MMVITMNMHVLWSFCVLIIALKLFFFYSRNLLKGHKPEDVHPPLVFGSLMDGLSSPLSPQHLQTSGKPTSNMNNALASTSLKDTSAIGNLSRPGWAK